MTKQLNSKVKLGKTVTPPFNEQELAGLIYYMREQRKYAHKLIWTACSTATKIKNLGISEQQVLDYDEIELCKLITGHKEYNHKSCSHIMGDIHRYKDYLKTLDFSKTTATNTNIC